MKKLRLLLPSFAALALALPATGAASLPEPKDSLIDVPKSIGGVALNQTLKTADKAWGRRGDCDLSSSASFQSCIYQGRNSQTGQATTESAFRGRVTSFSIEAGLTKKSRFKFKGRLLDFETAEGIGLGAAGARVKKAYPGAIKTANKTGYLIEGKGKSYMTFQTLDGEHVTAITVADGKHQG